MADFTPAFKGELQFRRYSDTSTQGQQVVFAVADREALECFIGKEGKRFAAMLVELTDDEQPVTTDIGNPTSGKPRDPLGDLCWRAVQWCKEPEFQQWIAGHVDFCINMPIGEEYARLCVQKLCDVSSRKELDADPEAARKFNDLIRKPYQKHLIARGVVR